MLLLLCRLVDVKIGFSFYYDNSTTDNIAPIDIWLVFSENKIHAFFFNTKYNRINIISAITRRFFPSNFPRFQLVSSFYRAYTLMSCFSRLLNAVHQTISRAYSTEVKCFPDSHNLLTCYSHQLHVYSHLPLP